MKTVWLLDVDGVVNASRPGWGGAPTRRHVWSTMDQREYPIRFAPPLLVRIRKLIRAGLVEVRWCSTWCGDTAGLEAAFALDPLPSAFTFEHKWQVRELKMQAAEDVLAAGDRLVWTDDQEVPSFGPIYDAMTADGKGLLIRPAGARGLQPGHIEQIERFVGADVTAATT